MAAPLPLDDQLCFALYAAAMAVQRAYKPLLDELGLTYPQYLVLHTLWEEDGRSVGAIAQRLALESSTITPLVKRMEAGGFVTRARDAQDERRVGVRLTPLGRSVRERCGCLAEAVVERSGMAPAALGDLNRRVRELRDAMIG